WLALGQHQYGAEVTSIDSSNLSEGVRDDICEQSLEPRHVHVDGRGVEGHARAVEAQARARGLRQGLLDSRQRIAQVAPGLRVLHVFPQKSCKFSRGCDWPSGRAR